MIASSATPAAPLIAVTTSELRNVAGQAETLHGEPGQQEMALGLKYMRAIQEAGGVPVVVPPIRDEALLNSLLDRVGGLCLTGGPDLDPIAYGAARHAQLGPNWRELDDCELALARLADRRHLPILGICRGLQALNVARGGTLHQHLPEQAGDRLNHRQSEPGDQTTHWVAMTGSSRVAEILGSQRIQVNSFHHQAVADLGTGLVITGYSEDGTVESLEAIDRDFVLGVQWHAECLITQEAHLNLFRAFTDAARNYPDRAQSLRRAA